MLVCVDLEWCSECKYQRKYIISPINFNFPVSQFLPKMAKKFCILKYDHFPMETQIMLSKVLTHSKFSKSFIEPHKIRIYFWLCNHWNGNNLSPLFEVWHAYWPYRVFYSGELVILVKKDQLRYVHSSAHFCISEKTVNSITSLHFTHVRVVLWLRVLTHDRNCEVTKLIRVVSKWPLDPCC